MVGLFGAFGDRTVGLDAFPSVQRGDGERTDSFADETVAVSAGFHSGVADEQPVETVTDDALVWVLGDVYGFERNGAYQPRPASIDTPTYCANLYESYGIDFVDGLNGEFAGIIYDREERTVFLLTDRLGSYPIFHTRTDDTLLCSTDIQVLARFPGVEPEFDRDYLAEFLAFKRSFGVTTPLAGIERLPPATVTAIDLDGLSTESRRYWWPEHTPKDEPFEYFVEEFVERFQRVLSEWVRDDQEYGLLLSGGSDSRLIMAAMDHSVVGFHMNDWRNREARVAKGVATTAGNEFRLLHRDEEYRRRSLDENPSLSNFDGWYKQGYPTAFADEITSSVDVLMSGLYADTLFKGHSIPSPKVSLGPLGNVTLPFETPIRTVDEFIERRAADAPEYLAGDVNLEAVLRENISVTATGEIDHHGVRYPSIRELVLCSDYYPLSNDTELIYTNSLRQLRPYRTPFLDNRLIDLHLTMPVKYQLRRNIIHRAIERLDSRLAAVPHSESGVPTNRSFPVEYLGKHLNALRWKHFEAETPPKPWCTHGPWPNDDEFIRGSGFVQDALAENRAVVDSHPLLDWDGVRRSYRDHLDGEDNTVELYTLLTLLEMPVTKQLCEVTETDDGRESGGSHAQPSDKPLIRLPTAERGGDDR
jgi:asparagine synthase (glutamine-hydrolysing)